MKIDKIGQLGEKRGQKATNILDLNEDCLEKIFLYLDTNSLLSTSETCRKFKVSAVSAFSRKLNKTKFFVHNTSVTCRIEALRLLREFGKVLKKTLVVFGKNDKDVDFFNIILDKCGSKLTEIRFSGLKDRHSQNLTVFLNKENMFRLNEKFTNLHTLEFASFATKRILDPECIVQKFSALTHLKAGYNTFTEEIIRKFIKLNPQVKSLEICHYNRDILSFIDKMLPQLEHLGLWINDKNTFVFATNVYQPLYFSKLKRLDLRDPHGIAECMPYIAISNQHMEEIGFHLGSCEHNLTDFVCEHYKELKKLRFYCDDTNSMSGVHLLKFATNLLNLTEIEFDGYYPQLIDEDIVTFVKTSKQLKRLVFRDFRHGDCIAQVYCVATRHKLDSNIWRVTCQQPFQIEIMKIA